MERGIEDGAACRQAKGGGIGRCGGHQELEEKSEPTSRRQVGGKGGAIRPLTRLEEPGGPLQGFFEVGVEPLPADGAGECLGLLSGKVRAQSELPAIEEELGIGPAVLGGAGGEGEREPFRAPGSRFEDLFPEPAERLPLVKGSPEESPVEL